MSSLAVPALLRARTPHRLPVPELRSVCAAYAADRTRWEPFLRFAEDDHWSLRLHSDAVHDVWLISWLQTQSTTLHDHGGSAGAFRVVAGRLHEYAPRVVGGQAPSDRPVTAGEVRSFGARYVHDVYNPYEAPAVSIHVYSPPLTRMSFYAEAPAGGVTLRRTEATSVPAPPERRLQEFHSLLS